VIFRPTRRQSLVMGAVELEPNWADSPGVTGTVGGAETLKLAKLLEKRMRAIQMKGEEEYLRSACLHRTGKDVEERNGERSWIRKSDIESLQSAESAKFGGRKTEQAS
jgi:hypothetical protein